MHVEWVYYDEDNLEYTISYYQRDLKCNEFDGIRRDVLAKVKELLKKGFRPLHYKEFERKYRR